MLLRPASAYATERAFRIAVLERLQVQTLGAAYSVQRVGDIAMRDDDYVHAVFDTALDLLRKLTSPIPH